MNSYTHTTQTVVNLSLPCHVVAPAVLQSLIVPLFCPVAVVLCLQDLHCSTAKCSFSEACLLWEAVDKLGCCTHLLFHARALFALLFFSCRGLWCSVFSELKPAFP